MVRDWGNRLAPRTGNRARSRGKRANFRPSKPIMTKKVNLNPKLQAWVDARKRYHLSHAQVQMGRELGLNPKKLDKMDNYDQEPWKMPLRQYIEHLYFKHFRKERPDVVLPIEKQVQAQKEKKAKKRQEKLQRRQSEIPVKNQPKDQIQ